jgi:hypothetical protein
MSPPPSGVSKWCSDHPWLTTFIIMSALHAVRVIFTSKGKCNCKSK